tara:strand:- start:224 stop:682 length:459 start_codon:yes stop_codon:yes gene_type:complete
MITKNDVVEVQKEWSDGIINIGKAYIRNEDYSELTNKFIDKLYAFDLGEVLFKPTLASDVQFRLKRDSALSYFIAGNKDFSEDNGFALKGWLDIIWENASIKIEHEIAIAMGNYYFINETEKLKVEFSFVYKRVENGTLKIILHDSHLPYQK